MKSIANYFKKLVLGGIAICAILLTFAYVGTQILA